MIHLITLNRRPSPPPLMAPTCDVSADALAAFLEGRLLPQEARDIESHLTACPRCRWIAATTAQFLRVSELQSD